MFENMAFNIVEYINIAVSRLKNSAIYIFSDQLGVSSSDLRFLSIILISATFILFITLTFIIYLKSLVFLIKTYNQEKDDDASETVVIEEDLKDEQQKAEEEEETTKKEEKEREEIKLKEVSEKEENIRKQEEFNRIQENLKKEETERQEEDNKKKEQLKKEEEIEQQKAEEEQNRKNTNVKVDFDWQKGQAECAEGSCCSIDISSTQYKQTEKPLSDLVGLILDMISRGVDDLKIAQTVMFRSQGNESEEQVLQVISALKEFIALCNKGKFSGLPEDDYPTERDALYHLAKGDNSYALALIQGLMEKQTNNATEVGSGTKREEIFLDISYLSCKFGTLASLNDIYLATNSFELAIELHPANIEAWSRVADMYYQTGTVNKAVWAYKEVLSMADDEINLQQIANANLILSQYYYDEGNSLKAAKLYNSSKQYYDSIGINRRLDRQEIEIIEIIEANQNNDLDMTITKLLGGRAI